MKREDAARAVGGEGTKLASAYLLERTGCAISPARLAEAFAIARTEPAEGSDLARALADAARRLSDACKQRPQGELIPIANEINALFAALAAWDTQERRDV